MVRMNIACLSISQTRLVSYHFEYFNKDQLDACSPMSTDPLDLKYGTDDQIGFTQFCCSDRWNTNPPSPDLSKNKFDNYSDPIAVASDSNQWSKMKALRKAKKKKISYKGRLEKNC